MIEVERLLADFHGIAIREARVDSKLAAGVTLTFCLSPTPLPMQWKRMFHEISNDKRGSVISTSDPLLHVNDVVWQVVEGDIPNAKHYVEQRVEKTNVLFEQMLAEEAERQAVQQFEATTQAEIHRLQALLDGA
jgi:hypothetical protein